MKYTLYAKLLMILILSSCKNESKAIESSKSLKDTQETIEEGIKVKEGGNLVVDSKRESLKIHFDDKVVKQKNIEPSKKILDAVKDTHNENVGSLPDHIEKLQKDYEKQNYNECR
jgi:hypothetical protein